MVVVRDCDGVPVEDGNDEAREIGGGDAANKQEDKEERP